MTREEKLRSLFEEHNEEEGINVGQTAEFMDHLDSDAREVFKQMAELAEGKKKWLKLYNKMQNAIINREFDIALEVFEELQIELF